MVIIAGIAIIVKIIVEGAEAKNRDKRRIYTARYTLDTELMFVRDYY